MVSSRAHRGTFPGAKPKTLASLGMTHLLVADRGMNNMAKLPLSHIKVLDLTAHRAGPTAVRQLADWGAQVVKIEQPTDAKTDQMGGARHGFDFQNLHRNKQAMTLNLKIKEGHAIFMKLAKKA